MWLRLDGVKISSTWNMICSLRFMSFCIFCPQNYLGDSVQGQFHLPATQSFLWRKSIKLEVLFSFENFHIATHGFLGCKFHEKYQIFHFRQSLFNASKIISGYLAIVQYVISRHISKCTFGIYIVLYGISSF